MSTNAVRWIVALAVACAAATARAELRIIEPTDPQAADIRAAASQFYAKLADRDAAGANALFAGPPAEAKLLGAHLRLVAASEDLRKSFLTRFGDATGTDPSLADAYRLNAKTVTQRLVLLNGDSASTSTGLRLRRIDGQWKVTHLSKRPNEDAFLTAFADLITEVRAGIDANKYATAAVAKRDMNERGAAILSASHRAEPPATAPPTTLPAASPWKSPLGAAELRSLIGRRLDSSQILGFIAQWPEDASLSELRDSLSISSEDAGISLSFNSPDRTLHSIMLYAEGFEQYRQYAGELPDGLSFANRRRDVEQKLGQPPLPARGTPSPDEAVYPDLGLSVTYAKTSPRDPDNPIGCLALLPRTGEAAAKSPRLAFRLVAPAGAPEDATVERLNDPDDPAGKATILVSREVLLDETAIRTAGLIDLPGATDMQGLSLNFTLEGALRLRDITAANQGRRLAVVLDGRVTAAPTIRGRISAGAVLNLPKAKAAELLSRISGVVDILPPIKP